MSRSQPRASGSLTARDLKPILADLQRANAAVARACPGERMDRQPVHTVYGGAHLFRADSARRLGALALAALDEYAPDAHTLAEALQIDTSVGGVMETVRARVTELERSVGVEEAS